MTDLKISIDTSGVSSAVKIIKRSYDEIKKATDGVVKSTDLLKQGFREIKGSSTGIKAMEGGLTKLQKAMFDLKSGTFQLKKGLIDVQTFTLRYGGALTTVKKGLKDTNGENRNFEKQIKKTSKAIKDQTNELKRTKNAVSNYFKGGTKALKGQRKALADAERAQKKYNKSVVSNELKRGATALRAIRKEQEALSKSSKSSSKNIDIMTIALGNLAAIGLAGVVRLLSDLPRLLKETSDEWLQFSNKVRVAVDSQEELVDIQKKLFAIAQETRTPLKEQATLFNRLTIAQKDLGASQEEILNVIKGVGFALGVTSTSALESRGALIQLSQAFGQGIVRAEEFNSIMEGAPRIAKALADGFGVTRAQMRAMVLDGKVTSKQFFEAFSSQVIILKKEFQGIQPTIEQSFQVIHNAFTQLIGRLNDSTGAAQGFANLMIDVSKGITALTPTIIKLGELTNDLWDVLTSFPMSTIDFIIELTKKEEDLAATTEKTIAAFKDLSVLEQFNRILGSVINNLWAKLINVLESFGNILAIFVVSIAQLLLVINASASEILKALASLTTFDLKGAKQNLANLGEIWGDYFEKSGKDVDKFLKKLKDGNKDYHDSLVEITSGVNPQVAALEEELTAQERTLKRAAGLYESAAQSAIDARKKEQANLQKRLKVHEEYYKKTGILDDELLQNTLKNLEIQRKASVASGMSIARADAIKRQKTEEFLKKSFQERNKLLEDFESARKKIISQTEKATLSQYASEKKAIDRKYTEFLGIYTKNKKDTLEVDTWYNAQLKKLEDERDERTAKSDKKAFESFFKQIRKIEAANKKSLKKRQDEYDKFLKTVEDETAEVFKDLFSGELDSFSDFTDRMKDMFFDMLAQMAAQAIAQPIIVPIVQSIAGGLFGLGGAPTAPGTAGGIAGAGGIGGLFAAGKTIFSGLTGGLTAGAYSALTSPIGASIGSSIFGANAYLGAGQLAPAAGFGGLGSGVGSITGAGGGATGIASSLSALAAPFALGALGYGTIGKAVGLPQGQYSGATAGLGAAAGYAGGTALGTQFASLGAIAGPLGALAGAVIGGALGSLIDTETSPRIFMGGLNEGRQTQSEAGFGFAIATKGKQQELEAPIVQALDARFTAIDDALDFSFKDFVKDVSKTVETKINPGKVADIIGTLSDSFASQTATQFAEALGAGDLGLDKDFFEGLVPEGGDMLDAFTRFGVVLESTEEGVDRLQKQIDDLGLTARQAFLNLERISPILREMERAVEGITTDTGIRGVLAELAVQWQVFVEVLKLSQATTEELTRAEEARNAALGASLTGLTASSLRSTITGGGSIADTIQQNIVDLLSVGLAESVSKDFLLPLNEEIGKVFIESGQDLGAVVEVLRNFDVSPIQDMIEQFQSSLITVDQARSNYVKNLQNEIAVLQVAQDQIQKTYDDAQQNYVDALQKEISAKQEAVQEAESLVNTYDDLVDSIKSYRREVLVSETAGTPQGLAFARSSFEAGVQGLFSGDQATVQASLEDLPSLGREFLTASKAVNADFATYQADVNKVLVALGTAEGVGDVGLTNAQQQLNALVLQQAILEEDLRVAQGIEENTKSLEELSREYYAAKQALDSSSFQAQIDYYSAELEALTKVNSNLELLNSSLITFLNVVDKDAAPILSSAPTGTTATISGFVEQSYGSILGRQSDPGGLSYWTNQLADPTSGITTANFAEALRNAAIANEEIPQFANGGISTGPSSGYLAELHGSEAVVPLQNGSIPVQMVGNNADNEKLERVIQLLESMLGVSGMMNRDQSEILDIAQRVTQGQNYINTKEVA